MRRPEQAALLETQDVSESNQKDRDLGHLHRVDPRSKRPHTLIDLSESWQSVAVDTFIALCVVIPGVGILALLYTWYHYSCTKFHLLSNRVRGGAVLSEFLLWGQLLASAVINLFEYYTYLQLVKANKMHLDLVCKTFQFDLISSLCSAGSILFWRILSTRMVEIYAHINCHKTQVQEDLNDRAEKLLEGLKEHFEACYAQPQMPTTISEAAQRCKLTLVDKAFVFSSLIIFMVLFTWMHLSQGLDSYREVSKTSHPSTEAIDAPIPGLGEVPVTWLIRAIVNIVIVGNSWQELLFSIISTISLIERNTEQMLLFTTLTVHQRIEVWDGKNRASIRSLLEESISASHDEKKKKEMESCDDSKLADYLPGDLAKMRLDLTVADDLWCWWSLRQYIQVDFVDESTIMDYCSGISMLFLLGLLGCAGLDWLVNKNVASPGLLLACFLSLTMVWVMNRIFQACVDINELLERDSRVLLDAEEDLHKRLTKDQTSSLREDGEYVLSVLRLVERKIELFDDKQQIFGITINKHVRNGWATSLALFWISYNWECMKPLVSGMDLDLIEDLARNATDNPHFFLEWVARMTMTGTDAMGA